MSLIKLPPSLSLAQVAPQYPGLPALVENPEFASALRGANEHYLHWDKFRWRSLPQGVPHEVAWAYLRTQRRFNAKDAPFGDKNGRPFTYWWPDCVLKNLNRIDRWSGEIIGTEQSGAMPPRERYVLSSLMDEAIASSQLEGAATTRLQAREMLRQGRKPRDDGEQMIYNNWMCIQHLREHAKMKLTPESLLEIHDILTRNTLKDPNDSGRLRARDDVVVEWRDEVVHTPPPAAGLPERVAAFCEFANHDDEENWIHPVAKAAMLHFRLGYDHPFVDGNGRTARALFYWYLLSRGYWLFEYLSISRYFLRAPVQYGRAYLYTESDEGDLNYFIDYNLRVVHVALQDLRLHLERKQNEMSVSRELLRDSDALNWRQRDLLANAIRHPDLMFTIQTQRNTTGVAYGTARADLLELERRGLLVRHQQGKAFMWTPAPGLDKQLRGHE